MKLVKLLAASAVLVLGLGLSACAPSVSPVITPVVKDAGALQGATVDLRVGQVLDINTGDLAVDSYTGVVDEPTVAEFVQGRVDGDTTFNPGVDALAVGTTKIVLSNSNGGIQDVSFTVKVTAP
ncbi:hypothetical protein [uncultured Microbacterium sp.]|uniref:hypothetical protein n=1 Tax=uncultured Microbacterium sp. TaxID=191216 RepID=UPI0035CA45FE